MDNFEYAPVDTPIYIIDDQHKLYVATLTMANGKKCRGECIKGDPEYFYRNALITWAEVC